MGKIIIIEIIIILTFILNIEAQKVRKINFSAVNMEFDNSINDGTFKLSGNVIFEHEGAKMYCDSAYYYPNSNSFDAYGNIHIVQSDTINLYGNILNYDGNTRVAVITGNVLLSVKDQTELKTESLSFDLKENVGYYNKSAQITRGVNKLYSKIGYYYTRKNTYFFKDNVKVEHPDYTIFSDTLEYNTKTNIAYFHGKTKIITNDTTEIYCDRGWYNMDKNISSLHKNVLIKSKKGQIINGDSIFYNRNLKESYAYNNVILHDTTQNLLLKGNYAHYNENTGYSLITKRALMIQYSNKDSLFMTADTLISLKDTSNNRIFKAYYRVKLFKSDFQGKCDSAVFKSVDSTFYLFKEPVIWTGENQLTAENIEIAIKNKTIDQLRLKKLAIIANKIDTNKFNQIRGNIITCYFKNDSLYKVDINGNCETIYYPEDNNEIIGINFAKSSYITIYLRDNKIDRIKFSGQPEASLYPLEKVPADKTRFTDFKWIEDIRPKSKYELFSN